MKGEFAEPIGGWKTLKAMHQTYLMSEFPFPSRKPLLMVSLLTDPDHDFEGFLNVKADFPRPLLPFDDRPETGTNLPITILPPAFRHPSQLDYALAGRAMKKAAIEGEWFAIGRRVAKRPKELLIPPSHWKSLRPNIEQGTAGRGELRYEDLRCAYTLLAKPGLQKMVKDALDGSELVKNGQPGRPSLMTPILPELDRRIRSGRLLPTRAEEARYLVGWLKSADPKAPRPAVRSVTNAIQDAYRASKPARTSKRTKI